MKKWGLLGGTFDPVHDGHLHLAICLAEAHKLDCVLFCPAYVSPSKEAAPPVASAEHRLAMVRLAASLCSLFGFLDWEVMRSSPSYTIDTVRRLKQEVDAELFLLVGEDQAGTLAHWKDSQELLALSPPLIGSRTGDGASSTRIPLLEISSTEIRKRLKEKKFCGHLVPQLVLDYIQQHGLYSSEYVAR